MYLQTYYNWYNFLKVVLDSTMCFSWTSATCLRIRLGLIWNITLTLLVCLLSMDQGAIKESGHGAVMNILCLLIFLQLRRTNDLWALVPLPSILLSVAAKSMAYPVFFFSNVSLGFPFLDLVTTAG
jgi:hypothetical protein